MSNTYIYIAQENERVGSGVSYGKIIKKRKKSQFKMPIKIGIAKNVKARIECLQTANPRKIVLLSKHGPYSRKEALEIERQLHKRMSSYHIRGEWFYGECHKTLRLFENKGFVSGRVASFREAKKYKAEKEQYDLYKLSEEAEKKFQIRLALDAVTRQ